MESFNVWWQGLASLNQWFFVAAFFFSVFFLWQLVMAIIGLGGGDATLDTHVEPTTGHDSPTDASETITAFKLLSVRSILAFCTLFSWAGALYMDNQVPVSRSLLYAFAWGIAAMLIVSWILHMLRRMTETGNVKIEACVGADGTVYLDIPAGGQGEVRVLCSGVMTHFKARAAGGTAMKSGTPVRVTKIAGPNIIEVETL